MKDLFITRFRLADYEDMIYKKLRELVQMVGKSVQAYAGRYKRLHLQGGPAVSPLNIFHKYWVTGLKVEIKDDVMMFAPRIFK